MYMSTLQRKLVKNMNEKVIVLMVLFPHFLALLTISNEYGGLLHMARHGW